MGMRYTDLGIGHACDRQSQRMSTKWDTLWADTEYNDEHGASGDHEGSDAGTVELSICGGDSDQSDEFDNTDCEDNTYIDLDST